MFDFALLFVAGVCQLALGIIGLRVSTRPPKKADRSRYELAFLVIGAAGLAAIVWSGLRSTSVQSGIADGVEKIEAKLGIKKDSAKQVSPANFDPVTGFNLCPQAWGRVPTKYYININGAGFQEYADKYKLLAAILRVKQFTKPVDLQIISTSRLEDIPNGPITLEAPENDAAITYPATTVYEALLVPNGVNPSDFSTLYQAEKMGVKVVWGGQGGQ